MQLVSWGWDWIFTAVGKEHNGVGDPGSTSAWNVAFVIPVMLESRSNVETMGTMGIPRFAVFGTVMDDDFASGRGHRCFIVVKHTMDRVVGAEFGVIAGLTE